jgi:hypothetical protein
MLRQVCTTLGYQGVAEAVGVGVRQVEAWVDGAEIHGLHRQRLRALYDIAPEAWDHE